MVRELTAPAPRVRLEEHAAGYAPREAKEIGKRILFILNIPYYMVARCDWITSGDIDNAMNSVSDAKSAGEKVAGIMFVFVRWAGAAVFVWGLYKFAMSIKEYSKDNYKATNSILLIYIFTLFN